MMVVAKFQLQVLFGHQNCWYKSGNWRLPTQQALDGTEEDEKSHNDTSVDWPLNFVHISKC